MDLVTFGEAMVRLTPPGFQRIEHTRSFDVHIGGAELNVAVAAARLGLTTRWVSRLTDNPLGRMIAARAREQAVDVSAILWTAEDRVGLYFAEHGAAPRPGSVLYDRARSAMAQLAPGMIDWRNALGDARWFHTSGISPALSETAAAATAEALAAARAAGITVSYDLNYRSKLWTPEQACAAQEPLMQHVDVLITGEEAARLIFGVGARRTPRDDGDSATNIARELRDRFGFATVAITLRESPRAWQNACSAIVLAGDALHTAPRYEVEIVDPLGAGDAFSAGLIYGKLRHDDWAHAVRLGTALQALHHTTPGDFSQASLADVGQLLAGSSMRVHR